jgi:hypothetical protein
VDEWEASFRQDAMRAEARKRKVPVQLSPAIQAELDSLLSPAEARYATLVRAAVQLVVPLLEIEAAHEGHDGAFEHTCTLCYREWQDNESYERWEALS